MPGIESCCADAGIGKGIVCLSCHCLGGQGAKVPIYAIKASGTANLVRALRTLLGVDPSAGWWVKVLYRLLWAGDADEGVVAS
jgi:hypothetical protein